MGKGQPESRDIDQPKLSPEDDHTLTAHSLLAAEAYPVRDIQLTHSELTTYRASDLEDAAAKVERGDGDARASMMDTVKLAKEQGVLDAALNKLEKEGKASITRDKDGKATEIVIDPATGPYDRGTKTTVHLKGEMLVDGRNSGQAESERKEAAVRAADASVDSSFLRAGERPVTAVEKERTKEIVRAMIDGDGEKLSRLGKELLSDPASASRVLNEVEKTLSTSVSIEKGDDGSQHVRFSSGIDSINVDQNGVLSSERYKRSSKDPTEIKANLAHMSDFTIYKVNSLFDGQNQFNEARQGAVTTPEERARHFNAKIQSMVGPRD